MKKDSIAKLHTAFENIVQRHVETATEFWLARELQAVLGYARWENFVKITEKAKASCEAAGSLVEDHFRDVTKMVSLGSGSQRAVEDIALTRYACYLIAQNGDPSKEPIAFAQTYFALQTRKQELIEQRLAERERLVARKKLTVSEKQLSSVIYERLGEDQSFARIRSRGDQALFGGVGTQQMKERLGVPQSRPLADFLPTITIKAKDFANEITNFNIKKDDLSSERQITSEHVKNNADVRTLLSDRGIVPEQLPAAEDLKKIERRHTAEAKKLPKLVERLDDE
ncbi:MULTISPECIES: DNA damage-inducible protein D [Pseudomonas]|uniref:DNA damage-inducible protein D n=1 Tax=Pseudomonas TaxID=286 RepID=UPI0018E715AA|nr:MULTISPECIES: DNA damage-inducible protein D [Pseudomonas]MBJ2349659.1 DNA damage-inducible protein D [Pseudomonas canavaninivorans]MBL3545451.1 DNA damage-inducible protein D [Pseudomonas sp. HB05]